MMENLISLFILRNIKYFIKVTAIYNNKTITFLDTIYLVELVSIDHGVCSVPAKLNFVLYELDSYV